MKTDYSEPLFSAAEIAQAVSVQVADVYHLHTEDMGSPGHFFINATGQTVYTERGARALVKALRALEREVQAHSLAVFIEQRATRPHRGEAGTAWYQRGAMAALVLAAVLALAPRAEARYVAAPLIKVWPAFALEIPGTASWYGEEHRGDTMANGQPFDPDALTAAMDAVPLGSLVRVRAGGRDVWVIVTDRPGSGVKRNGRLIDLSAAAFRALAPLRDGLAEVHVEIFREVRS